MKSFDWPGLMRQGLVGLGMTPAEFWALTPAEFLLLLGHGGSGTPSLNRARLMELAAAYPDTTMQTKPKDGTDDRG
jgi:uncharacterized phage protein (TIGR02216 family)